MYDQKIRGILAAGTILLASMPAAFAQQSPARNGSDTTATRIRTDYGSVRVRNTEANAEAGYFSNSAGAQGGSIRLNLRRIFTLGGSSERDYSSGIYIDPGVRLRVDGTADDPTARRDIQISGIGAYRYHTWTLNGREPLTRTQQAAVAQANQLAIDLTAARIAEQTTAQALTHEQDEIFSILPPLGSQSVYIDRAYRAGYKLIEAIQSREAWAEDDIHALCTAQYLDAHTSRNVGYTTEQAGRCIEALRHIQITAIRDAARAAQQATQRKEQLQTSYNQAMARIAELLPLDGEGEQTDQEQTVPNATGEVMAPHASFVHRHNYWTGLDQTGAMLQGIQAGGHIAVRINNTNVDFCGYISPIGVVLGQSQVGTTREAAMYRGTATGCVGVGLGPVGHLRNEASAEAMVGANGSSAINVSNFVGIERIANTPLGAGYRYEWDRTSDNNGNTQVRDTHFGVLQGNF